MATTTDIKNGLCINFNNDIYTIVEFLHVKPGKGAAFVRTKMRNVKTGRMLENTFPSGAKIDIVRVERRPYTYLYKEGDMHVFMHTETYEQIYIPEQIINAPQFLKDGRTVSAYEWNGYYRDVATAEEYWKANLELTAEHPELIAIVTVDTVASGSP